MASETARRLAEVRGARLVAAEDLHLTLRFVGARPSDEVGRLAAALRRELRGAPAPELELDGPGAFPGLRAPRVLWLGVRERADGNALADLFARADRAASVLADPGDARPPRPHVTLARLGGRRGGGGAGPALEAFRAPWPGEVLGSEPWRPVEVELLASGGGPGGSRYRTLERFPLGARDSTPGDA